jgi:hypothetical protein
MRPQSGRSGIEWAWSQPIAWSVSVASPSARKYSTCSSGEAEIGRGVGLGRQLVEIVPRLRLGIGDEADQDRAQPALHGGGVSRAQRLGHGQVGAGLAAGVARIPKVAGIVLHREGAEDERRLLVSRGIPRLPGEPFRDAMVLGLDRRLGKIEQGVQRVALRLRAGGRADLQRLHGRPAKWQVRRRGPDRIGPLQRGLHRCPGALHGDLVAERIAGNLGQQHLRERNRVAFFVLRVGEKFVNIPADRCDDPFLLSLISLRRRLGLSLGRRRAAVAGAQPGDEEEDRAEADASEEIHSPTLRQLRTKVHPDAR